MSEDRTRQLRIFLCHANGDKPAVRQLYTRLKTDGFDPWLDEEKLIPGQLWREEIPKAVQQSDVVVVCLSEHSTTKEGYLQKEVRFALDVADEKPAGTIFLIPARLEACAVPDRLSDWQWVNLHDEERGYGLLMRSLEVRAESLGLRMHAQKPLPEPEALEPEPEPPSSWPPPPGASVSNRELEELFRWVETPREGRVDLWKPIPAGKFQMGSPQDEEGRYDDEALHEVVIEAAFWMTAVPVTNAQFLAFRPDHSLRELASIAREELLQHPVVRVSWDDGVEFCQWLERTLPWARGVRLPTEEEWEYACRAGTGTRFWNGDSDEQLAQVGWYRENSGGRTHEVGEKEANPWGLYDVHGNVWEWCSTEVPGTAAGRVLRGGSWLHDARHVRSAHRNWDAPGNRDDNLGLRLARGQGGGAPG